MPTGDNGALTARTEREREVLGIAEFVLTSDPEWLSDPVWIAHQFAATLDQEELIEPSVAAQPDPRGFVDVGYRVTSRLDLVRHARAGLLPPDEVDRLAAALPFDRDRERARPHDPVGVVRALAVHYLSRAGGGARSIEDAARYYTGWELDRFDRDYPSWTHKEHRRILRDVVQPFVQPRPR
jgi:hypothetical protein